MKVHSCQLSNCLAITKTAFAAIRENVQHSQFPSHFYESEETELIFDIFILFLLLCLILSMNKRIVSVISNLTLKMAITLLIDKTPDRQADRQTDS